LPSRRLGVWMGYGCFRTNDHAHTHTHTCLCWGVAALKSSCSDLLGLGLQVRAWIQGFAGWFVGLGGECTYLTVIVCSCLFVIPSYTFLPLLVITCHSVPWSLYFLYIYIYTYIFIYHLSISLPPTVSIYKSICLCIYPSIHPVINPCTYHPSIHALIHA
jgi:hypothetical protein